MKNSDKLHLTFMLFYIFGACAGIVAMRTSSWVLVGAAALAPIAANVIARRFAP